MADSQRGTWLTICAICFALLSVSNFLKPLHLLGENTGFVFFGTRLSGAPNAIIGPLFGAFLLAYAASIWTLRRHALPMAHAYASYVVINLFLWQMYDPNAGDPRRQAFGLVYAAVAIGVSVGAAVALTRRKHELR
ncbi:MAG: hypothetical protein U0802_08345 [Candidatus Binatia bacterium]